MWIPTSAADVVERIVQPCAPGSGVRGADADCSLSCHVSSVSPIEPRFCPLSVSMVEKTLWTVLILLLFVLRLFLVICFAEMQISFSYLETIPYKSLLLFEQALAFIIRSSVQGKNSSLLGESTESALMLYLQYPGPELTTFWSIGQNSNH